MFIYGSTGLSLVGTSRGYSLVAVHGLLIVVASFVVEHGLSCSVACGIFLDQDQTHVPCTGGGFLTTGSPGKSSDRLFVSTPSPKGNPKMQIRSFLSQLRKLQWLLFPPR